MGRSHITAGGLLIALVATGCGSLEHNRPACRWAAAGVGFVAGGLIGGLAINSLDLSGTKQTGAVVGNYACPEGAPPAPPEPVNAPPPETPPGAAP